MKIKDLVSLAREFANTEQRRHDDIIAGSYGSALPMRILVDGKMMAEGIEDIFGESSPCGMPLAIVRPGIAKIEIPEDAIGMWDPKDARAFAVDLLKACDEADGVG